jgi:hypothetical protein
MGHNRVDCSRFSGYAQTLVLAGEDLQASPYDFGFVIQLNKGFHCFFEGN